MNRKALPKTGRASHHPGYRTCNHQTGRENIMNAVENIRRLRKAAGCKRIEPTITDLRRHRDHAEHTMARLNALPGTWNAQQERAMANALQNFGDLTAAIRERLTERERERRNRPVKAKSMPTKLSKNVSADADGNLSERI